MRKSMMTIKWLLTMLLITVISLTGCTLIGEEKKDDETEVSITSITVTSEPTTVEYEVGDDLNTTGLVVTATYSDETTEVVAINDLTVTGFDSSEAAEDQVITISYEEMSTTFTVNIVVARVLSSIAVTVAPTTDSMIGDDIDTTGLEVTATFTDDSTEVLDIADLTFTGYDNSAIVTDQEITVTYEGQTTTFTIDVIAKVLATLDFIDTGITDTDASLYAMSQDGTFLISCDDEYITDFESVSTGWWTFSGHPGTTTIADGETKTFTLVYSVEDTTLDYASVAGGDIDSDSLGAFFVEAYGSNGTDTLYLSTTSEVNAWGAGTITGATFGTPDAVVLVVGNTYSVSVTRTDDDFTFIYSNHGVM